MSGVGVVPERGDRVEHLLGLGDREAPSEPQLGLGLQGRVQGDGDLLGSSCLLEPRETVSSESIAHYSYIVR